jgi:hypothetical protein
MRCWPYSLLGFIILTCPAPPAPADEVTNQ